jgi:hypothetical protein
MSSSFVWRLKFVIHPSSDQAVNRHGHATPKTVYFIHCETGILNAHFENAKYISIEGKGKVPVL